MIVFGLSGLVLCGSGVFFIKNLKLSIYDFSTLDRSVRGSAESINLLIDDGSRALENVSLTVRETEDTLASTSELTRSAAKAIYSIAQSINFDIAGYKPLEGTVIYFYKIGIDLESLAENIEGTAGSIGANADDIDKIAEDMQGMSEKLGTVSGNFSNTISSFPDFGFKKIIYGLLIYCCFLNLMFVLTGYCFIVLSR
jgi:uncharacterized protein YukE